MKRPLPCRMFPCKTQKTALRLAVAGLLLGCSSGNIPRGGTAGAGATAGATAGGGGTGGTDAAGTGGSTSDGESADAGTSPPCVFQGTYQFDFHEADLSKTNAEECSVIACAGDLCSEFLCTPGNPVTRCASGDLLLLEDAAIPAECSTLGDQIEALLQTKVQDGVLLDSAVPCGPEGIAARPDSFVTGTSPDVIESVTNDFTARCQSFVDCLPNAPAGS
jgi:hypothetical protein